MGNEFFGYLPLPWCFKKGDGPVIATAIHNGNFIPFAQEYGLALSQMDRMREEDPFTEWWTEIAPTQVVVNLSRFWVDLNRPRDKAAYLLPEDAWGMKVWNKDQDPQTIESRLSYHDRFFASLFELLEEKQRLYSHFIVLDLHTYNHRRGGPDSVIDDPTKNPEINIGTGTMGNRWLWERIIDRFINDLKEFDYQGRTLDVRENIKFQGGYLPEWVHRNFPGSGCVLSIEVKKIFMDEWTGVVDLNQLNLLGMALSSTIQGLLEELEEVKRQLFNLETAVGGAYMA
ncbi:MAG: N-formylglutamate amidohydrolase [Magnetococcales bacterium]|nr:N-formylglutamate amidohydrolase [Magnetococcales bacterium]